MSTSQLLPRSIFFAALADVLVVLLFALVGRSSHAETVDVPGVLTTVWPFAVGLAAGWLVTLAWRSPTSLVRAGFGVWAITVVAGLVLRFLSGQGNALGFVIVTTVVLGVGLLGWRICAKIVATRRRTRVSHSSTARVG